jgi:hypothetical protein
MPAKATCLLPPCCVSTHRSRGVDPDGPATFLDHREAVFGIPQRTFFTPGSGPFERFPVESSPPPISEDLYQGEAPGSLAPCTCGSNVTSPSVSGLRGCAPAKWSCTRPLRINILPPNRVQCPQLNPFWRGQDHGLTPVLLPTRSVRHHMALRHVACHLV